MQPQTQPQTQPRSRPIITITTDEISERERTVQLGIDGLPIMRLTRADTLDLLNEARRALLALDWIWADYFYARGWHTVKRHLIADTADRKALRTMTTLCGRKPQAPEYAKHHPYWDVFPVVGPPSQAETCQRCLHAYEQRPEQ